MWLGSVLEDSHDQVQIAFFWFVLCLMGLLTGLCIGPLPALLRLSTDRALHDNLQFIFLLRLNVCNDLAKAMKALDGKKRIDQVQITHHSGFSSGHDRVNQHGAGPGHIGHAADRPTCVCLPSGLYHARSGRVCSIRTNQEVTPPGIYFFDGWRVRPCMKIPTDLPQSRDPPERDVQRQRHNQTSKHEIYLPRLPEPSRGWTQHPTAIRACRYFYALVQQHGPQLQRCVRLPKNTPRVAPQAIFCVFGGSTA